MKKIILIIIAITFVFAGCGTIRETSTTITEPITIPAITIHDTVSTLVELPMRPEVIDSIGRWYLDNYCKGTVEVDKDGLKLAVNFWTKTSKRLADSLDATKKTVIQLGYEVKKKEQEIQQTKKVVETVKTPGQFWIWSHSFLFQFIAFVLGAVALFVLRAKTELLNRFIP